MLSCNRCGRPHVVYGICLDCTDVSEKKLTDANERIAELEARLRGHEGAECEDCLNQSTAIYTDLQARIDAAVRQLQCRKQWSHLGYMCSASVVERAIEILKPTTGEEIVGTAIHFTDCTCSECN